MWKNAISGTAMAHCEGIQYYQVHWAQKKDAQAKICQSVLNALDLLPWYLRLPLKVYAFFINLFSLLLMGHRLNNLSSEKKQYFMQKVKIFPLYAMYNKFVRANVFLKLFDDGPC